MWAARDAAVRGRVLFMVRELCALLWCFFCAPLRCATTEEEPEAAPHDFLRGASRANGGLPGAPPPRPYASYDGRVARPESQMQRLRKVLQRRAHRCPAGAQGTRDRSSIECCELCSSEAACGQHFQP